MTNAQQFETFMRNYQNMVFSTAMRLLANHTDAEDVAQEVFLRAYERFDQLRGSPTAGGWLKTVATNLSLNHLSRYRSRWSFFSELFGSGREENEEHEMEFPAAESARETPDQADRRALVEQALQKLPAAQRVPLLLYAENHLPPGKVVEPRVRLIDIMPTVLGLLGVLWLPTHREDEERQVETKPPLVDCPLRHRPRGAHAAEEACFDGRVSQARVLRSESPVNPPSRHLG